MDDTQMESVASQAIRSQLAEGKELAQHGERGAAAETFREIIHADPNNEDAWLWLAYVSEDRRDSLNYMREAHALMPDSERIAEGLRWAEERLGRRSQVSPSSRSARGRRITRVEDAKPVTQRAKAVAAHVDDAAQVAQETAAKALDGIKSRARSARGHLPELSGRGWRTVVTTIVSVLAIAGIVGFALLGISNARRSSGTAVSALVLPTPVPNPTATLTVEQRAQPFWTKVDVSWTRENWSQVVDGLEYVRIADPQSYEARARLAEALHYLGLDLIEQNDLENARLELDRAIRLDAGNQDLQKVRRELRMYLSGLDAYAVHDWPRAVEFLSKLHERNPGFRDTSTMLGRAWYEVGMERQDAEVWDEARDAYEQALNLTPSLEDAEERLKAVMNVIIPPKRIEVDLSDKIVTLYEDNQVLETFVCCTGRSSTPTLPGRYQIQSKMPMAYASQWDLDMPWWLGIYWAGGSENGFHALPILSSGQTLWRSALGTGCSFGCIVLDTRDAIRMYDWADIGDVVLVTR